ncbi:MAG TPA: hypothetical protein VF792_10310 [Ktedonobacterales bacterium]
MERFYRALRGLTITAIVLGVLTAGFVFYAYWPPTRVYSAAPTPSLQVLYGLGFQTLQIVAGTLGSGACVMGIVLAWLDHRKRWFVALMIVTFVTHLFPVAVYAWVFSALNQRIQFLNSSSEFAFIASLLALALTLLFTRTPQGRVDVDDDLGITRSAI